MAKFNLSSTILDETQNHDDFIVVWLCSDNILPEQVKLIDNLQRYSSFEDCVDFITTVQSERKLFFVIVNNFELVSYFNGFPQIQSIYFLKKDPMIAIDDLQQVPKLIGIFVDEDKLIKRLRNDILLTYRHDLSITISCLHEITTEQSLTSLHGNTLMFMWNQVFIYYLIRASDVDQTKSKDEMITQCRLEYAKDKIELEKIDDFEKNFQLDQVLACYTKSSFAYRLLNKALRTRNINLICKFIYLITLLHEKLQKLSKEQEQIKPRNVFRGQIMKENNRARLKENIGFLISMNTFMSTSTDESVARAFIEGANGVIFKINTGDIRNNTLKPFADISEFSLHPDEKEVLFFVGAVFRIDSVTEESNSIWIIEMTLSNETDEQIKLLTDDFEKHVTAVVHIQDSFMKTDDFTMAKRYYTMLTTQSFPLNDIPAHMINQILAYFCSNLGNYKKAIELYENLLLEKTFIDKPKRIVLNIIIGYNYFNLSQYKNALDHYEIASSLLDDENLLTGELYNHIGDTWQRMNNFDAALLSYQEAERILRRYQDNSCLRDIYLKISELYQQQADSDDASIYREKANRIKQQVRPTTHLNDDEKLKHFQDQLNTGQNLSLFTRADLFYNIGLCFIRKGDFPEALNNLSSAETLFIQDPPSSDRFVHVFATLYENFALVYLRLNQYLKALIMWKKAIDIRATVPWT